MDNQETVGKSIYYDGVTKEWVVEVGGVERMRSEDYSVAFEYFSRAS